MDTIIAENRISILEKIAQDILEIREDVISIVAFGSFAKGGIYQDVDLLIVLEALPDDGYHQDYLSLINSVKNKDVRLDLLIYSKNDAKNNFNHHVPLFLDIAFDGVILYDKDNFVQELMDITRRDVTQKGIKRIENRGWRFPVGYREPTYLSKISNEEWANIWLIEAEEDYKGAKELFNAGIYSRCHTLCQQAIEKVVKSVLSCFGVFERSHYVASALDKEVAERNLGERWVEKLDLVVIYAQDLEPDATRSRYPGERMGRVWIPSKEFDEESAKKSLEKACYSIDTAKEFYKWWFKKSN